MFLYFLSLVFFLFCFFQLNFFFAFSDVIAPFKKRRSKYMAETTPAPSDHLLRPLSPITPPLPEDSLHPLLHHPCAPLLSNGLAYSPMPSLPASRCNTPLQFEVSGPPSTPADTNRVCLSELTVLLFALIMPSSFLLLHSGDHMMYNVCQSIQPPQEYISICNYTK